MDRDKFVLMKDYHDSISLEKSDADNAESKTSYFHHTNYNGTCEELKLF